MEKYLLIVAGGFGSRFSSELPKQFADLNGIPVLMKTINAFLFLDNLHIVLILPSQYIKVWEKLCTQHDFDVIHQIVEGGPKRFHSVKSGLKLIPDDHLVAIHDGVRPMVSKNTILQCFDMATRKGNGIPSMPIQESVRSSDGILNKPIDRKNIFIIQTPQVFHSTLIKKAYRQNYDESFLDDATVLESYGEQIYLTKGNKENIKITDSLDLKMVECFNDGRR